MKSKRKHLVVAAFIILGAWLLSLGLFHERNVSSSFRVETGDAWAAFEDGNEPFYPNTWINSGHHRTIGVPYLIHSVSDRPPYGMSFCFTANVDQNATSITIKSINVVYDNGLTANVVEEDNAETTTFDLDNRGEERGEKPYLRANFSFSDCLTRRESFWATITGSYTIGDDMLPYKTRVYVNMRDETYWYPGWIALLLRQL